MKIMVVRERNTEYLDWNKTFSLKPVYSRRFIKNGWTHISFNGEVIEPFLAMGLFSLIVTFKLKEQE